MRTMKWISISTSMQDDASSWLPLTTHQRGRWLELNLLAARLDQEGAFSQNGSPLIVEQIAVLIRANQDELREDLKAFKKFGIIHMNGRGLELTHFKQEQEFYCKQNRRDTGETPDNPGEPGDAQGIPQKPHLPDPTIPDNTIPVQDKTIPHQTSPQAAGVDGDPFKSISFKPGQLERARWCRKVFGSAALGDPKNFETSLYVATRISLQLGAAYVMAALASAFADPEVKNPVVVAASRLQRNRVPEDYLLPKKWKTIPPKILEAAGIPDLDKYIVKDQLKKFGLES